MRGQSAPGRRASLVRRLTHLNVAVLALAMLASFVLVLALGFWTARDQQRQSAEAAAGLLVQGLAPMLAFEDKQAAQALLLDAARRSDLREIEVLDAQGRRFAQWRASAADAMWSHLPGLGAALQIERSIEVQGERVGRLRWREVYASIEQTLVRSALGVALLMLAILVLAANALSWVQRRALAPLVALSELTEQVAARQDYGLRARVERPDEVGRLGERVNELLERVQAWQDDLHQQLHLQREAGQRLRQLAHRDHLTGLPNRLSFEGELGALVRGVQEGRERPFALFFIDLDHFKAINDQLGHEAGDEVLIEVCRRLGEGLREADTLFRLGGDEFALLVDGLTEVADLTPLAERLIGAVGAPLTVRGRAMPLGASIGAVVCPLHGVDAASLLRQADAAMYAAKAAGKNCFRLGEQPASHA